AVGAALSGWRACWLDHAFMLTGHTKQQLLPLVLGLGVNIVVALALTPAFGPVGAAMGSVVGYLAAFIGSYFLGRRLVPLRLKWSQVTRAGIATMLMAASLSWLRVEMNWLGLAWSVAVGGGAYGAACLALDVVGLRSTVARRWAERGY